MSTKEEILTAVDALESSLRGLLAVLDEEELDVEALRRAWSRCAEDEQCMRALEADIARFDELTQAALRDRLISVTRLNAVAADLCRRDAERAQSTLAAVGEARRQIRNRAAQGGETGGSVDLAG